MIERTAPPGARYPTTEAVMSTMTDITEQARESLSSFD
jgi:hypothetical protein